MKTLIVKLGATGDVVRTTPLLNILPDEIDWITRDENVIMLTGNSKINQCIPWSRALIHLKSQYDLVINLEDSIEVAQFLNRIKYKDFFGSYVDKSNRLVYTESSKEWFDMSLISRYGKGRADEVKFRNRKSYQEIVFGALGYFFNGEKYFLPAPAQPGVKGDIAIASKSGAVWPMKNWAYYDELKSMLEDAGYKVNMLPLRPTLIEHIADVQNHKYLICGDSLPMHIALGSGIKCVTLFQCTSPWEIYDYGLQTKIVSPLLERFFYKRSFDIKATTCILLEDVYEKVFRVITEG